MVLLKQLFTKRSDELLRSTVALVTRPIIRSRKIVWILECISLCCRLPILLVKWRLFRF